MDGQMDIADFLDDVISTVEHKKTTPKPATCKETAQTRRESNNITERANKHTAVLNVLGSSVMTAREVAEAMYKAGALPYPARAIIQPRLTELVELGALKVVGKKQDDVTGRNVAQYWKVRDL